MTVPPGRQSDRQEARVSRFAGNRHGLPALQYLRCARTVPPGRVMRSTRSWSVQEWHAATPV